MNPRLRRGGRNHNNNHNNNARRNNVINRNTVLDSLGPSGKLRGTAYQLMEKYLSAAKDYMSTDRVLAENCLQHAEHYMRLNAYALAQENQNRFNNQHARSQNQETEANDVDNTGNEHDRFAETETVEQQDEESKNTDSKTDFSKMDLSVPVALMSEKAVEIKKEKTVTDNQENNIVPVVIQKRRGRPAKKKTDIAVGS